MILVETFHSPERSRDDRSFPYRPCPLSCTSAWRPYHQACCVSAAATFINTLMSAEADAICGVRYGESSPDRPKTRNGYLESRFDTLDVALPKLRSGSSLPGRAAGMTPCRAGADEAIPSHVRLITSYPGRSRGRTATRRGMAFRGRGVGPPEHCRGRDGHRLAVRNHRHRRGPVASGSSASVAPVTHPRTVPIRRAPHGPRYVAR